MAQNDHRLHFKKEAYLPNVCFFGFSRRIRTVYVGIEPTHEIKVKWLLDKATRIIHSCDWAIIHISLRRSPTWPQHRATSKSVQKAIFQPKHLLAIRDRPRHHYICIRQHKWRHPYLVSKEGSVHRWITTETEELWNSFHLTVHNSTTHGTSTRNKCRDLGS